MNRILLVLIFCIRFVQNSLVPKKRIESSLQDSVLKNKSILLQISAFVDNPYKNLASVNKSFRRLFEDITPGPILAIRLGFKEAEQITEYNVYTKLLFEVSSQSYIPGILKVLKKLSDKNTPDRALHRKIRSLASLGIYRYLMMKTTNSPQDQQMAGLVFSILIECKLFDAASKLFIAFPALRFPNDIICTDSIRCFLISSTKCIDTENFSQLISRFIAIHLPGIFSFLLSESIEQSTFLSYHSSLDLFVKNLKVPKDLTGKLFTVITETLCYEHGDNAQIEARLNVLLDWLKNSCDFVKPEFLFYTALIYVRFSAYASVAVIVELCKLPTRRETISIVALYSNFIENFFAAVDFCGIENFSKRFKNHFMEKKNFKKEIFDHFTGRQLLKLFDGNLKTFFKALQDSGTSKALQIVNDLDLGDFEVFFEALKYSDLEMDKGHASKIVLIKPQHLLYLQLFASGVMAHLGIDMCCRIMSFCLIGLKAFAVDSGLPTKIELDTSLFFELLQLDSGLVMLQQLENLNMYWSLSSSSILALSKSFSRPIFEILYDKRHDLLGSIVFNMVELVSLIKDIDTWVSIICPLFDLDPKGQFNSQHGSFWPPAHSIEKLSMDSALYGFEPILKFVNGPNSWNILPRLAQIQFESFPGNPSCIFKMWSQNNLNTFIFYAPDEIIRNTLNRDQIISQWMHMRPQLTSYNQRIATVFLSSKEFLVLWATTVNYFFTIQNQILPFLASFGASISSKIIIKYEWIEIVRSVLSKRELYSLLELTSHSFILQVFEDYPQLKVEKQDVFNCLHDDFDLIINFKL